MDLITGREFSVSTPKLPSRTSRTAGDDFGVAKHGSIYCCTECIAY